jgi:hypothetical protein
VGCFRRPGRADSLRTLFMRAAPLAPASPRARFRGSPRARDFRVLSSPTPSQGFKPHRCARDGAENPFRFAGRVDATASHRAAPSQSAPREPLQRQAAKRDPAARPPPKSGNVAQDEPRMVAPHRRLAAPADPRRPIALPYANSHALQETPVPIVWPFAIRHSYLRTADRVMKRYRKWHFSRRNPNTRLP